MKQRVARGWGTAIGAGLLLLAHAVRAEPPALRFERAAQAAAKSDWSGALRLYRQLEDEGYAHGELLFNLAVACESKGEHARAVWYYRRAMRERPYDPYLKKNLSRVLWQAGAPGYRTPDVPGRGFRQWPMSAWVRLARWGYAVSTVSLGLLAWTGKIKRRAGYSLASGLALALAGAMGMASWAWADRMPEAVVTGRAVAARFAPVSDHAAHFHLPHAAVVRTVRAADAWRLVELDGRKGWVPADALAPLDMDPDAWAVLRGGRP